MNWVSYLISWSVSRTIVIEGSTIAATGLCSSPPPSSIISLWPSMWSFPWWPLTTIVELLARSWQIWQTKTTQVYYFPEKIIQFYEAVSVSLFNDNKHFCHISAEKYKQYQNILCCKKKNYKEGPQALHTKVIDLFNEFQEYYS